MESSVNSMVKEKEDIEIDKSTAEDIFKEAENVVVNDLRILISAEQGKGVNTAGDMIGTACANMGLYVYQNIEYHSNIIGKNSYLRLVVTEKPMHSHYDESDVAVLLGADAMVHVIDKVRDGGAVIYNTEDTKKHFEVQGKIDIAFDKIKSRNITAFGIPAGTMIKQISNAKEVKPAVLSKMINTMLVGATYAALGADVSMVDKVIEYYFRNKPKVIPLNKEAAKIGFDYIKDNFKQRFPMSLADISGKMQKDEHRLVMKGTDAVALGAINAGMQFYIYYPITPASDAGDLLDSLKEDAQIIVEQVEDEIAAMNGAIGAGRTGVRAMTGTSGPGFDLKTEALGMAVMNEDPVVILLAQRPGPSTGLPTRGDQSDLFLSLFAGHGGAERIVVIPGDVEDIFYMIQDAFNHADVYQMPVIFLTDKHLMNSTETIEPFDLDRIPINRGQILSQKDFDEGSNGEYKRYKFTDTGISPRSVPGIAGGEFNSSTDEHTEFGIITDDPENRLKFNEKRFLKIAQATKDIPEEKRVAVYGDKDADVTLVGWGGTKGPIIDGMYKLQEEGVKVNYLQIKYGSPFPAKYVKEFLQDSKMPIIIEENRLSIPTEDGTVQKRGQMEFLIKMMTGFTFKKRILKENTRPFSVGEIKDYIKKHMEEKSVESIFGDRT